MDLLLLGLLWILWCTLHSLLIARPVTGFLMRVLGDRFRYHRLLYNVIAVASLAPLLVLTWIWRGEVVFVWQGGWQFVRFLLLGVAALLFWGGAQRYDMGYLTGIRQIRAGKAHSLLSGGEEFSTAGVFGLVRHPWYLGSLLLLWSILPVYHLASLLAAGLLSAYLVIGTVLEERKLVAEYGDLYRTYQRQVSMLLPWKWLRSQWQRIK